MNKERPKSVSVLINGEAFEVDISEEPFVVDMTDEEFEKYLYEVQKSGEGNSLKAYISAGIADAVDDYFAPKPTWEVTGFPGHDYEGKGLILNFQKDPVKEVGVNGTQSAVVLEVLIDRYRHFQTMENGKYACRENAIIITKLEEALMWDNYRTEKRKAQKVEGRNIAHKP